MIAVLQRVSKASVTIDGICRYECGRGLCVLLGVAAGDTEEDAELLCSKISRLRIFPDEDGKMNLSVTDIGGALLVIPNFTLLASYRKGNRPDFLASEKPDRACSLFLHFTNEMKKLVSDVGSGEFGADMKCAIFNDGPVTIVMDSNVLKRKADK